MSYTIEYNKQIFYIQNEEGKTYFLFIRQGDNNVRDMITNIRVKDWDFIQAGTEKELWKTIGKRLGGVVGGDIQKSKGWEKTEYFTPEEYIRQYRSKFKNAKPLERMLDTFSVEAFIYLRDEFQSEKDKETEKILRGFIQKYKMEVRGKDFYDKTKIEHVVPIRDFETLKDFLLNMPVGWRKDYYSGFRLEKRIKNRVR